MNNLTINLLNIYPDCAETDYTVGSQLKLQQSDKNKNNNKQKQHYLMH